MKQEALAELSKQVGIPIEVLRQAFLLIETIVQSTEVRTREVRRLAFMDGFDFFDTCTAGQSLLSDLYEKYPDLLEKTNIREIRVWLDVLMTSSWDEKRFDDVILEAQHHLLDLEKIHAQFSSSLQQTERMQVEDLINWFKEFLDLKL